MVITPASLTGQTQSHVVSYDNQFLHPDAAQALTKMQQAAALSGFDLKVASGFRSFERQVAIWNAKATGRKLLLDAESQPLDFKALSKDELMWAIMTWTAVPGASRHHWGTEVDIFDHATMPPDYKLQLIASEYEAEGIFERLGEWLDQNMQRFGFFRPYSQYQGGVRPEPWHLSYFPVADTYLKAYNSAVLEETIASEPELQLRASLIKHADKIYANYVQNISPHP